MKKILVILFSLFLIFILTNCSSTEPEPDDEVKSFSDKTYGEIELEDITSINLENIIGGIIVYGSNSLYKAPFLLSKVVEAESTDEAIEKLNKIELITDKIEDTLNCKINYPFGEEFTISNNLEIELLRNLKCNISNMRESIYVFYMNNDLTINNVSNKIEVKGHLGSCDLKTSNGDIKIEIAIPDSGFCNATTDDGDIYLYIPTQTSATIIAKTGDGEIIYNNLTITNLISDGKNLSGIINDGSSSINIEVKKGNIVIEGI